MVPAPDFALEITNTESARLSVALVVIANRAVGKKVSSFATCGWVQCFAGGWAECTSYQLRHQGAPGATQLREDRGANAFQQTTFEHSSVNEIQNADFPKTGATMPATWRERWYPLSFHRRTLYVFDVRFRAPCCSLVLASFANGHGNSQSHASARGKRLRCMHESDHQRSTGFSNPTYVRELHDRRARRRP